MELAIILISVVSLFFSLFIIYKLYSRNTFLRSDNVRLRLEIERTKQETDDIMSIDPGDKAIIPEYGLTYPDRNKNFKITYEVEIIEVSVDKVKVNAISFEPHDRVGRDPKNKSGIIGFMQNKWISKKDIELIVDDSMKRDAKLTKLGIV